MICDFHTHIAGSLVERRDGRIQPARPMPRAEFLAQLDRFGIERAVVLPSAGLAGDYQRTNDGLVAWCRGAETRLLPFCTVHPYDGDRALRELERTVRELGALGLKLHPWSQSFPAIHEATLAVVEAATDLGIPILFHDGTPPYCSPLQIAWLAGKCPRARIVLGHAGLGDFGYEAIRAAQSHENIHLVICGPPFAMMRRIIETVGADRIMFGSDFPFGGAERIGFHLDLLRGLDLDEETERKIMWGNAARLLGIEEDM